ncbi:MAG: NUDIX hydrolase [Candidatus Bipolaricaulota bacterium]
MADERWLYRGRLISVELVETPAGKREVVHHPGAVAIVVRDEEGRVLLVRQFRAAAGRDMWEIPAGTVEPGESPLATAKRELLEETGMSASTWSYLGTVFPTPGYSDERIHLYLAEGSSGEARGSAEVAEALFFSRAKIMDLVQDGLGDGKTLAALALVD